MAIIDFKSEIGADDISLATGGTGAAETFDRRTSTGGILTQDKIDASHLKFRTAQTAGAKSVENLVDGSAAVDLYPKNATVGGTLSVTGTTTVTQINSDELVTKGPEVDARAYGAARTKATIDAALTAIGSKQKTLVIHPDAADTTTSWAISADLTIPANVSLRIAAGAVLAVATTKTLTINGTVQAGAYQIFSCAGTGKVVFGSAPREVYPQWWGAVGDGATDNSAVFQLVDYALPAGGRVVIPPGQYMLKSNVLLTSPNVSWVGNNDYTYGNNSCQIITNQDAITLFSVSKGAWSSKWENISFVGNGANGEGGLDTTSICFHVKDLTDETNLNIDNFTLQNCSVGLFGIGLYLHARNAKSLFTDYYQCHFGIYVEEIYTADNRALQVLGGRITDCGLGGSGESGMGIYIDSTAQFRGLLVQGVDFENNDYCIYGGSLGNSLISNNLMLFCHSQAIYLDNSAYILNAVYSGVIISGNTISCPAPGNTMRSVTDLMYLKGGYFNVVDNQFSGSQKNALVLESVYFTTIMNNLFNNCCMDGAANYSGITIDANCGWIDAINNKFVKTIAESLIYNGITNACAGSAGYIHITGTKSYGMVNAEIANTGAGAYSGLDYATYSGATPAGNVTPAFIGQDLLLNNTGTYSWWRSTGATNTDWLKMSN